MNPMTGLDKVALLLKSLGPKAADTVLAQLGPEHAPRVRARMQQIDGAAAAEAMERLLGEVAQALSQEAETPANAPANEAPAPRPPGINLVVAEEPNDEDDAEPPLPSDPLKALPRLAPPRLARALEGESPRTVSLLLNLLDTPQAGEVYKRLPSELRREVSLQMATQSMPPREVLQRIAQGIVKKAQTLGQSPPNAGPEDRVRKMAELMRLLERTERTEVLTALEAKDATMAQRVKEMLYQFDDLLKIENMSVQKLLAELDTKTLATALRGATPAIQHKILSNLSKRAQDTLNEEIDLMGNVAKARVDQARQGIADVIRRLDERGELVMIE